MGVREFTNKGSKKVIGKFASHKLQTTVWWESQIERDYIYLLEIDREVSFYQEQPFHIAYQIEGQDHSYTPDFYVERGQRQQVIEVKPAREVDKEENARLFRIIRAICARQNREFAVVTETMIRVQPRLSNIKLLYRYAKVPLEPHDVICCQEFLALNSKARLSDVSRHLTSRNIAGQVLYALIYRGILKVDFSQPINSNSLVSFYDEALTTK